MEVIIIILVFILLFVFIANANSSTPHSGKNSRDVTQKTNFRKTNSQTEENLHSNFNSAGDMIYTNALLKKKSEPTLTIHTEIPSNNSYQHISNQNKWFKKDEPVIIKGYTILTGMIYVGDWLCIDSYSYSCEASLINPKLEVNRLLPDSSGTTLSYWPSYSDLLPEARALYLNWLATGKDDPNISIGYVFLYFYGLERRLLIDLEKRAENNQQEIDELQLEIKRLLQLYKKNNSFKNYASNLLVFTSVIYKKDLSLFLESDSDIVYGEYPIHFKILLADYALNQKPIGYDVALKWLEFDPFTYLRTPSKRCKKEFESIFAMKFNKKYGEGIYIKPNKTHLTVNYRPASGSLNRIFEKKLLNYPDVTKLTKYIERFRIIAQECENELDAHSRYLGRKPDDTNSFVALSLLPSELLNSRAIKSVESIREDLKSRIENNIYSYIDVSNLMKLLGMDSVKLNKNEVVAIVQFLSKIGVGIEPDLRFSGQLLNPEDKAIIFSISNEFPLSPSKEYSATLTLINFAITISTAPDFSTF